MPVVEKTDGGTVLIRPISTRFSVGDRAEVDDDMAEYLTEERGDFEVVETDDTTDDGGDQDSSTDGGDEPDAESESDDTTDGDEGDEDSSTDEIVEDGEIEIDAWLDQDYQDREEQVRDGDVDEHLEAIDEAETSATVRDAIGERRAELEA